MGINGNYDFNAIMEGINQQQQRANEAQRKYASDSISNQKGKGKARKIQQEVSTEIQKLLTQGMGTKNNEVVLGMEELSALEKPVSSHGTKKQRNLYQLKVKKSATSFIDRAKSQEELKKYENLIMKFGNGKQKAAFQEMMGKLPATAPVEAETVETAESIQAKINELIGNIKHMRNNQRMYGSNYSEDIEETGKQIKSLYKRKGALLSIPKIDADISAKMGQMGEDTLPEVQEALKKDKNNLLEMKKFLQKLGTDPEFFEQVEKALGNELRVNYPGNMYYFEKYKNVAIQIEKEAEEAKNVGKTRKSRRSGRKGNVNKPNVNKPNSEYQKLLEELKAELKKVGENGKVDYNKIEEIVAKYAKNGEFDYKRIEEFIAKNTKAGTVDYKKIEGMFAKYAKANNIININVKNQAQLKQLSKILQEGNEKHFTDLEHNMFQHIDAKFFDLTKDSNKNFGRLEQKLNANTKSLNGIGKAVGRIEGKVDGIAGKLDEVGGKLGEIEKVLAETRGGSGFSKLKWLGAGAAAGALLVGLLKGCDGDKNKETKDAVANTVDEGPDAAVVSEDTVNETTQTDEAIAAEEAKAAEEARKAEEARAAEEAKAAEEARKAEEARAAEEAKAAEEARKAEEARAAEEAQKAEEAIEETLEEQVETENGVKSYKAKKGDCVWNIVKYQYIPTHQAKYEEIKAKVDANPKYKNISEEKKEDVIIEIITKAFCKKNGIDYHKVKQDRPKIDEEVVIPEDYAA